MLNFDMSRCHFAVCRHQAAIEEICRCASRELELEAKMRGTEEEWTEQVKCTT